MGLYTYLASIHWSEEHIAEEVVILARFGCIWPQILYPWDVEVADGCFGWAQGLMDLCLVNLCECETGHGPEIHSTVASPERKCPQKSDFEEADKCCGYYIHGTLKRLTDVVAWLKAWWIHFGHRYYIRGTLKWLMGVLVWFKAWWIHFDHGYYIRGTLKWLMGVLAWLKASQICTRNPCLHCLGGEEMPPKVMILAQFEHGYYIRGTLKRLMVLLAWLKAWWICFGHGYYIRGTLKRPTDVVVWLQAWWICAWWICVSVKQVTDQKSMPLLPRWGGKVVILAQFGHRYYICGTLKWLTGVLTWLRASWIKGLEYLV
ncbi:hypothetical protein C8R44DRAFT_734739 [Mycena epipterygia]|nr:hypothetical protein C8R44DRAFT_734739 [Mycena epipterygia]